MIFWQVGLDTLPDEVQTQLGSIILVEISILRNPSTIVLISGTQCTQWGNANRGGGSFADFQTQRFFYLCCAKEPMKRLQITIDAGSKKLVKRDARAAIKENDS